MKTYIESRVKEVGQFICSTHSTIRSTAKVFGVSKSTVAKDVERLSKVNPQLLNDVRKVLEDNWEQKSVRGGASTKMKYMRV